jgi:DNA repair exonuclease SbcCD ATPase subunit
MKKTGWLLFTLLSLAACNSAEKNETKEEVLFEDKASNEKLDAYVAVHNYFIGEYKGSSFLKSFDVFYKNFGDAANPNLKQESPSTYLGNNYNWGLKMAVDPALALTQAAPTFGSLDSLEANLCNKIKATNKLLDQFFAYYEQKNYLTDNYKTAETLHTQIIASVNETRSIYDKVEVELDKWIDKRDIAHLDKMKDAQPINYHLKYAQLNAQGILDEIKKQGIDNDNIPDLNVASVKPLLENLKVSSTELASLITDEKEISKSHISTHSTLQRYKKNLDGFIGQMNVMLNNIANKKVFTKEDIRKLQEKDVSGNYHSLDGSVNALVNAYNEMIDAYNYIV